METFTPNLSLIDSKLMYLFWTKVKSLRIKDRQAIKDYCTIIDTLRYAKIKDEFGASKYYTFLGLSIWIGLLENTPEMGLDFGDIIGETYFTDKEIQNLKDQTPSKLEPYKETAEFFYSLVLEAKPEDTKEIKKLLKALRAEFDQHFFKGFTKDLLAYCRILQNEPIRAPAKAEILKRKYSPKF